MTAIILVPYEVTLEEKVLMAMPWTISPSHAMQSPWEEFS